MKDQLSFYASRFSTVEVNSTFYRPATERTLKSWIRKTSGRDFYFTIKVPGSITHDKLISNTNRACSELYEFQKTHLEVLDRAGKLGAVLLQLPPFFRIEHSEKLLQLLSSIRTEEYRVFVEVRGKSLYRNAGLESQIIGGGASMVSLDSPESHLEDNFHSSGKIKYVRLHGRNEEAWRARNPDRNARYDYEYSEGELMGLEKTIMTGTGDGDEIFIYFNNHPAGKAPRNASHLLGMLGIGTGGGSQQTLS